VRLPANSALTDPLPLQRSGAWLERQSTQLQTAENTDHQWLIVQYQIINAPEQIINAELPSLEFFVTKTNATKRADVSLAKTLPWPFTLGPIIATDTLSTRQQPNRVVAAPPTTPIEQRLKKFAVTLALILLTWLAWWVWRERTDTVRLPFARARYRLKKAGNGPDTDRTGYLILHDAINECAGYTVQSTLLDQLVSAKPWLAPHRNSLQAFFTASSDRFFAGGDESFDVRDLCRQLYRAEKRYNS